MSLDVTLRGPTCVSAEPHAQLTHSPDMRAQRCTNVTGKPTALPRDERA
jgi:hypothetical protein